LYLIFCKKRKPQFLFLTTWTLNKLKRCSKKKCCKQSNATCPFLKINALKMLDLYL